MALIPGQNLVSESENEGLIRRPLRFHPVSGNIPVNQTSKLTGVRDFATNLVFNVVDSALFGVPSSRMQKNIQTQRDGFWDIPRQSYGERWERMGIKPWQELTGASKFGMGIGQAAGFFIPFSGISRVSTAAQRAMRFNNYEKLVGDAVNSVMKNINYTGSNSVTELVKTALRAEKPRMPYIYRTTPEQYQAYSRGIQENIKMALTDAFKGSPGINARQIEGYAEGITRTLEEFGKQRKFVDNLPDLINTIGLREGAGKASPYLWGYVGRAVDQGANMAMFDMLGRYARAVAGEPVEGVDDVSLRESMTHSAGFAAAISLADFIPGGRRAGLVQDFYRFSRNSLKKGRKFSDMHAAWKSGGKGKDALSDNEIRSLGAYFGQLLRKPGAGHDNRSLAMGAGDPVQIAAWLDKVYSSNRKELLNAIMRDGGRSLVESLPRAAVDAMITATYMGFTGSAIINDEALIGDYLVGAFMAMRAYQPLNPRHAMRWRYNNSIDAKFHFMESLGADVSALRANIPAMNQNTIAMDFISANLEKSEGFDQIYSALYGREGEEVLYNPAHTESRSGHMKERAMLDQMNTMFMGSLIRRENNYPNLDAVLAGTREGKIPSVYNLSDSQVLEMWNKVKDVRTRADKSINDYDSFNRFLEDYNEPIYNYHSDMLINHVRDVAKEAGIYKEDTILEGGSKGTIVLRDWHRTGPETPQLTYMLKLIDDLSVPDASGRSRIKIERSSDESKITIDPAKEEAIQLIAERYADDVATQLDSAFNFSSGDHPSLNYIATYASLRNQNRMYDAILGEKRKNDDSQSTLTTYFDSVIGENVSVRSNYEVELPKKAKSINELDNYQAERYQQAQRFINDIIELKRAAQKTENDPASTKIIKYEDAINLLNFAETSGIIRNPGLENSIYGNLSHDQIREQIYTDAFIRSGLDEVDYIALRTIQEATNQTGNNIEMITNTEQVRQVIKSFLTGDGKKQISDDVVSSYLSNYMSVVDRLRKTGRISDAPPVSTLSKDGRRNLLQAVELVNEMYSQRMKSDADSIFEFAKNISKKIDDSLQEMIKLDKKLEQKRISSDEHLDGHSKLMNELKDSGEIGKILPRAKVDFSNIIQEINDVRAKQTTSDQPLQSNLFGIQKKLGEIASFMDSLQKLTNVARSSDAWSFTASTLRNHIQRTIDEISKNKEYDSSGKGLLDLIRDASSHGDYLVAKTIIDKARESSLANQGISKNVADRNNMITVDHLRELLDTLSATETRSRNVASFIRRMQDIDLGEFYDGSRLSDLIINKLKDRDNFKSNIRQIVESIKSKAGDEYFRTNQDNIARELFAATQTVVMRDNSRDYVKIEDGKIVLRTESNIPETLTTRFVESMKGFLTHQVKQEIYNDGKLTRFSDFDGNYMRIEAELAKAYGTIVFRNKEYGEKLEALIAEGKNEEAVLLWQRSIGENSENLMQRPVFVDLKASDDMGIVIDLNPESASRLKDRLDSFSKSMLMGETNDARRQRWINIKNQIDKSLDTFINLDGDMGQVQLGDFRAGVRAIYYGEQLGKEYFWSMVGRDVNESIAGQSRLFKYAHHFDNTNATTMNARMEGHLNDILSLLGTTDGHRLVAQEALRRKNEGVRIAFYNDDNVTVRSLLESVVRSTLTRRFSDSNGNITIANFEARVADLLEKTINDYYQGKAIDAKSLDAPIHDGAIYASENSMRHDVYILGKDFDIVETSDGFSGGSRAAKISLHNTGTNHAENLLGKLSSRYDPGLNDVMKNLGVDYIVPSSQAKVLAGKENLSQIKEFDVSKSFGENLSTVDKMKIIPYDPSVVRYMFAAHGLEDVSRSNASVTHYWDYQALKDYSSKINIEKRVSDIVFRVQENAHDEATVGLGKLLLDRFKEISTSGDFSHLGVIEKFLTWGVTSNHSLVRDQVMRHLRDLAMTDIASVNNSHISNTFLFSNHNLASPIFADSQNNIARLGEINISHGFRNVMIGNDLTLVVSHSDGANMSDYVIGKDFYGSIISRSTNDNHKGHKLDSKLLKNFYNQIAGQDYENVFAIVHDINTATRAISEANDKNFVYKSLLKLYKSDYGNLGETIANIALYNANNGFSDMSLGANVHKIPKKFGPDSVIDRVRGFVDAEKGNINELNNYEIAMQHQADQDGDKISVYMDNPGSSIISSVESMMMGREAPTQPVGERILSPNVFNEYSVNGVTSRRDGNDRLNISNNNTLNYISQERKSKLAVGSLVKQQGIVTMLHSIRPSIFGQEFNVRSIKSGRTGQAYHRMTGIITQSILDAWKGVHPDFLDIRKMKDLIYFGDLPEGLKSLESSGKLDNSFIDWSSAGGLFGKAIDARTNNTVERQVYRDIVREYMRILERSYSVFGDVYDGGVRMKPTFDVLHDTYRDLQKLENNDYTSIYRTIEARYKRKAESSTLINAFENVVMQRGYEKSQERYATIFTIEKSRKPSDFYPQLIALKNFVTDDKGSINSSLFDSRSEMYHPDDGTFKRLFTGHTRGNNDHLSSDLRIKQEAYNDMVDGFKKFLNDSRTEANLDYPKRIGVYKQVLERQIDRIRRKMQFSEMMGDREASVDLAHDLAYYKNKLTEVERKIDEMISSLDRNVPSEVGKAFVFQKGYNDGRFVNNIGKVYAYKITNIDGRAAYEFAGVLNRGETRYFDSDHVILMNPIEMVHPMAHSVSEGHAMNKATSNYTNILLSIFGSESRAKQIDAEIRSIIEYSKSEIRKVDLEAYDSVKDSFGQRNDFYNDSRMYIDNVFSRMLNNINDVFKREGINDSVLSKESGRGKFYDAVSRMIFLPRAVANSYTKDVSLNIHAPYYKIDKKFITHFTRFLSDYNDRIDTSVFMKSIEGIMRRNEIEQNRQHNMVDNPNTVGFSFNTVDRMTELESMYNNSNSLLESLERLGGKDYSIRVIASKLRGDMNANAPLNARMEKVFKSDNKTRQQTEITNCFR